MGGIRAKVDISVDQYRDYKNLAMVILPGGLSWEKERFDKIASFIHRVRDCHVPVAAICGATYFLGQHGFLDTVKHTGDSLAYLQTIPSYQGEKKYIEAQVVSDQGIITANETAAVEFAYEIFKQLEIDSPQEIDQWYTNFTNGAV